VDTRNRVDPQCQVVSYVLTQFLRCSSQNRSFSWILFQYRKRCGGVLMVSCLPSSSLGSPQRPPSGASLSTLNWHVQVRLRHCSTTISGQIDGMYIHIERLEQCMPYCNVAYLVTVTKMNMIRWNASWLCIIHSYEHTAPTLPQSWTAVSAAVEVPRRSTQRSQELQNWPFYKSNLVASWMPLYNCRCFQEDSRLLLESLRALWSVPGGSGSI